MPPQRMKGEVKKEDFSNQAWGFCEHHVGKATSCLEKQQWLWADGSLATQKELHSCTALVLRLARATKPGDKTSSEWQSHQSRAVSGRTPVQGVSSCPENKKNQKGKPGTNKLFCLWQSPCGIWYDSKSKQFLISLLFSLSFTYLCLDLLRLSFSLPSSLLWSSTHSSVIFAHLSSSHSAHSHYTLNSHISGSISRFFQNFPINSPLLFCAKQDPKISLPCTCSHHNPRHLAATLHYPTLHSSASPASHSPTTTLCVLTHSNLPSSASSPVPPLWSISLFSA